MCVCWWKRERDLLKVVTSIKFTPNKNFFWVACVCVCACTADTSPDCWLNYCNCILNRVTVCFSGCSSISDTGAGWENSSHTSTGVIYLTISCFITLWSRWSLVSQCCVYVCFWFVVFYSILCVSKVCTIMCETVWRPPTLTVRSLLCCL